MLPKLPHISPTMSQSGNYKNSLDSQVLLFFLQLIAIHLWKKLSSLTLSQLFSLQNGRVKAHYAQQTLLTSINETQDAATCM